MTRAFFVCIFVCLKTIPVITFTLALNTALNLNRTMDELLFQLLFRKELIYFYFSTTNLYLNFHLATIPVGSSGNKSNI